MCQTIERDAKDFVTTQLSSLKQHTASSPAGDLDRPSGRVDDSANGHKPTKQQAISAFAQGKFDLFPDGANAALT